jgi:hypothetical protein
VFGTWPDVDSNGRLNIIIDEGNFYGFEDRYRDGGCDKGDFINLGNAEGLNFYASGVGFARYPMQTIIHEATHWIDLIDTNYSQKPYWSIEGFAVLVEITGVFELTGRDFFVSNSGGRESLGGSVFSCWTESGRYGYALLPGAFQGDYTTGCGVLRYLIEQRLQGGADRYQQLRTLKARLSRGDLGPIWTLLGGTGRTEEELEGEYLLSQYADDYASGISDRLTIGSYNLRAQPSWFTAIQPFLFPMFTTSGAVPSDILVSLSMPDGIVFELADVPDGTMLNLPTSASNLSVAIVKRQ